MRRERAGAALVFLIVLATHVTYESLSQGDFYYPDSFTYLTPALGLLHGDGFSTEGMPETLRTPGYPLFLLPFLAIKAPAGAIVAAQHLLDALLAAAIYILARRSGARAWIAFAAALILAFDTITIHYANKILTETLSAVIVFAIFVIAVHRRSSISWLVAAGLLCGALVLVRPVAIAYFCVVMLWLIYVRVRTMTVIAFVAAAMLLPLAWATRNAAKTGVFTISPIGSNNLLMHRAAGALAMEDGGDFKSRLHARQQQMQRIVEAMIEEGEGAPAEELTSADVAKYYSALARKVLLQHPRGAMLVTVRGFLVNMFDTDWDALAEVVDDELIPERATEIGVHVWTWIVWIAAFTGLAMLWRRDRAQALLVAATVFYFVFMAAGGEAEARFRAPVIPLMAYAAAFMWEPVSHPDRLPSNT
ncbi:MAG TPA: hypothetical protein VLV78_06040 [Thermoanaerobaculia bacterium]|nr:hypothetical protein [Thermoanaerobaculia bacterium]